LKTIITGARGFLGSALLEEFKAQGHQVLPMSFRPHSSDSFLKNFASALSDFAPDAVINTAASQNTKDSQDALAELIESNITVPASMCALLKTHRSSAAFITFGTSWQFGEDGAPEPFNAYASSKASLEPFLDHFAQDGLRCATMILYDTYGPSDTRNKITNLLVQSVRNNAELDMSDGNQAIDLVHIQDTVRAITTTLGLLLENAEGCHMRFAIRSGRVTSPRSIVEELLALYPQASASWFRFGRLPYRKRERFRLDHLFPTPPGWTPAISLSIGLRDMLNQHRPNKSVGL
jgi:nucleoside-diphosphate-sugar epimerase